MKRPTRKFISFSTALVSMLSLIAPVSAASLEAELMEECEYDELFETRDKAILIKDGNDENINDDTQIIVIDSNGEKQLLSKEQGLNGLYSYVTTTRGKYNFISPTGDPYSFDFFDTNYRISTESGSIIAGFGDKFALIDSTGKKLSAEYDAIYRISNDYYMVDVIDSQKQRTTGLIKADGSVVAAPAKGIGAFYLLTNGKFLVSKYTTETVEGEEKNVYSYYFMDGNGKTETTAYKHFHELGNIEYELDGNESLYKGIYDYSDPDYYYDGKSTSKRYAGDYSFENNCICLTDDSDKVQIYNSKTESFSEKYDKVETLKPDEKFIVQHDGVYDIIDSEFKVLIKDAKNISFNKNYNEYDENNFQVYTLKVKKDGKVTTYDNNLKVLEEADVTKLFPTFYNASVTQNGNTVTVTSDSSSYWNLDKEYDSAAVDIEIKPVHENGIIADVSLGDAFDSGFSLKVTEEYDNNDFTETTNYTYKYILDSSYKAHDISEYKSVAENINHDIVVFYNQNGQLEYVNFKDATDKKDLSQYNSITPIYNYENTYPFQSTIIGYRLESEDSFVISDTSCTPISDPIKVNPTKMMISLNDGVYSGNIEYYDEAAEKYGVISIKGDVIIPAEYDKIIDAYNGYLVTKDGNTIILGTDGKAIETFNGEYSFVIATNCPYDADWNLVKRVDNVTSNIVFNIEDKQVKYQQEGKYDEVSRFVDGYASVIKYANNNSDDLWNSSDDNLYGIININGIEIVKPSEKLSISFNYYSYNDSDNYFDIYVDSSTQGKDYSYIKLSTKELDTGYLTSHSNMTLAKMISEGKYIALVDGLWGVFDTDGKEIIKPQFDYFSGFNKNGLSIVETPESNTCTYRGENGKIYKTGVIDVNGNVIVKPFNNIAKDGMEVHDNKYGQRPCETKTLMLDEYGINVCKLINGKPKYTTIYADDAANDFAKENGYDIARKEGNIYYVEKDGLAGIVSEDNDVLVPVEYSEVLSFSPSARDLRDVLPEFHSILKEEFTSKLNKVSDDIQLAYVKTVDNKIGVYKITESDDILGDANNDGVFNVRDAAYIARMAAQGKLSEVPKCADYNKDNVVNIRDAAAIARFLAKRD